MQYKRYKSELPYSYALGMAPTVELVRRRPERALTVFTHPKYRAGTGAGAVAGADPVAVAAVAGVASTVGADIVPGTVMYADPAAVAGTDSAAIASAIAGVGPADITNAAPAAVANIYDLCNKYGVPCVENQKIFNIIADKENIFVAGVFSKGGPHSETLDPRLPHAVFVNPADAGNLGANVRTCAGFDFNDIAIIKPGADIYSPKAVRASMGAIFHIRTVEYDSYEQYAAEYPNHVKYCFMLNGETELNGVEPGEDDRVSLIFGNEATGLPDEYLRRGRGVRIAHTGAIDSLNLSVAVGIAANAFYTLKKVR